jgi:2,4-dienoyl-CoA reductase-like NADH-dependent reductase (Old Yellow Enzyme family)
MNLGSSWLAKILRWALFGTPRGMTMTDIKRLIQQFANTALLMSESGFAGVELHAAHGYLLSTLYPFSERVSKESH